MFLFGFERLEKEKGIKLKIWRKLYEKAIWKLYGESSVQWPQNTQLNAILHRQHNFLTQDHQKLKRNFDFFFPAFALFLVWFHAWWVRMTICTKQNILVTSDATRESTGQTLRETQEKWPRIELLTLQTKKPPPFHSSRKTDWICKNGRPVCKYLEAMADLQFTIAVKRTKSKL